MLKIKKALIWAGYGFLIYVATLFSLLCILTLITAQNVPARLPHFDLYDAEDFVFAQGTWVIEGDTQAHPVQTSKIECERSTNKCNESLASISTGEFNALRVELESYEVVEWTDQHLTYVNNIPTCVFYRYTIDWSTKSVTGIRIKREDKISDRFCDGLGNELRLTLKDGLEVYNKEVEKNTPKVISQLLDLLLFRI